MSKKTIITIFAALCCVLLLCAVLVSVLSGENEEGQATLLGGNAKGSMCFLLLGKDRVSSLTDVIMLVSVDEKNERLTVMQIPRDTYAQYSEDRRGKINTASANIGAEELCEFLSSSLGVRIDGYASFDLDGFAAAVDAIGGVEMEIERELVYSDPAQNLYIRLSKGHQILDGKKAEMLVRYRKGYVRGDLDRLDVQKQFLRALFKKVKASVNISNVYSLVTELLPHFTTDLKASQIARLALLAVKMESESLNLITLPGEDAWSSESGGSFYVMSALPTQRVLEEYFGKTSGVIDRDGAFRHPRNPDFQKIYDRE